MGACDSSDLFTFALLADDIYIYIQLIPRILVIYQGGCQGVRRYI